MHSRTSNAFRRRLAGLPPLIREQARNAYAQFSNEPFHPGLQFKELANWPGVWSARVGLHYRVLGRRKGDDIEWFWIGPHAEYDRLVRQR